MTVKRGDSPPVSEPLTASKVPDWLPPEWEALWLEMQNALPAYPSRRQLAEQTTELIHDLSHRTIERWPIPVRYINGMARPEREKALEYLFRRLLDTTPICGGRSRGVARTASHVATKRQAA
jgi:hypothetical protein